MNPLAFGALLAALALSNSAAYELRGSGSLLLVRAPPLPPLEMSMRALLQQPITLAPAANEPSNASCSAAMDVDFTCQLGALCDTYVPGALHLLEPSNINNTNSPVTVQPTSAGDDQPGMLNASQPQQLPLAVSSPVQLRVSSCVCQALCDDIKNGLHGQHILTYCATDYHRPETMHISIHESGTATCVNQSPQQPQANKPPGRPPKRPPRAQALEGNGITASTAAAAAAAAGSAAPEPETAAVVAGGRKLLLHKW